MKFTLDTTNKTIQLDGYYTSSDITELFINNIKNIINNILKIENMDNYTIEINPSEPSSFWTKTNTHTFDTQRYTSNNTLNSDLKVVYNNILEELY